MSSSFRSYGRGGAIDRHDYAQLVLPLRGQLEIEIAERGARLDETLAALVAPGTDHAQSADGENLFLVIDCTPEALGDDMAERVSRLKGTSKNWLFCGSDFRRDDRALSQVLVATEVAPTTIGSAFAIFGRLRGF